MSRTELPAEFDGFRLVRQIGEGGMGRVFLAQDTLLDRRVAIKFIAADHPDPEARSRFLLEARAIARLQHPCVVAVYRVGDLDGRPYIVSEFVEGESLDKLPAPIPWRQALRIAHDLARGLTVAHRAGVVHRDIKPANAILSPDGTAKLLDFGIARLVGPLDMGDIGTGPPATAEHLPLTIHVDHPIAVSSPGANAPTRAVSIPLATTAQAKGAGADDSTRAVHIPQPVAPLPFLLSGAGITTPGKAIGTPAFMAPEVWQGQPASFSSDVYSLGALVYALCAGHPPHKADSVEVLRDLVCFVDSRPLADVAPEADPAFCAIIDRCLRREPALRFQAGGDLRLALSALVSPTPVGALPPGNPYRGLRPFEADHQALFFGRDSEIRAILDRLRQDPVVIVTGDSGVGKSSLCRAGVLPRIGEWLGGDLTWLSATAVPGREPATAISAAISQACGIPVGEVFQALLEGPSVLGREVRRVLAPGRGLVLFVDQLEEIVTQSEPEQAEAVCSLFGWTRSPTPGFRIVATVRGDFLGRLASLRGVGEYLSSALYFLRPLSTERIREAVLRPAQATGIAFESEATVDALVDATPGTGGGLPLLQFALSKLWDARDQARAVIPASALDALGGVAGALSLHADEVLASLGPAGRERARRLLLLMVTAEGTRSRRTRLELAVGDAVMETLDALVSGRLVFATEGPEGPAYEIAHEALLSGWGTLSKWLAIDADGRVLRARLAAACTEWERLGRQDDALWSARQVAEARTIEAATLTPVQKEFLASSRRHVLRRRIRRGVLAGSIVLALLATWAVMHFKAEWERDEIVDSRMANASRLNESAAAQRDRALGLRTASLTLFDERRREPAEEAWKSYRKAQAELDETLAAAAREAEAAIAIDPTRPEVRELFAELLFERAEQAERAADETALAELLQRMVLYDVDGSMQKRWNAPATLSVTSSPPGATARLDVYQAQEDGRLVPRPLDAPPALPYDALSLLPGSYRLTVAAPGRVSLPVPFLLRRGEHLVLDIPLPKDGRVPEGFAFIPPGRFLVGSTQPDGLRTGFLHAVPLHQVETGAYLIATRETTFSDWLAYVASFPPAERSSKVPSVHAGGFEGSLTLTELPDGRWKIDFQPTSTLYSAVAGTSVVYPGRKTRSKQNWLNFPVVGITAADAAAYAAWLDHTGRIRGARLCTDFEWEKAARGADGREYPHGSSLSPEDANFDETYAKDPSSMGPDEAGSHPASVSPYGLYDMSGNVWEWVVSSVDPEGHAARGGSFYFDVNSARTCNRETPEPSFRDVSVGFRVCAAPPL